jgi:hypothetical protein
LSSISAAELVRTAGLAENADDQQLHLNPDRYIEAVAVVMIYGGMQDVLIAHGSLIGDLVVQIKKVESTCRGYAVNVEWSTEDQIR